MPNSRYVKVNPKILNGEISWLNDNIKIVLLSPSYPGGFASLDTHEFFSDVSSYVLTGTKNIVSLTNKSVNFNGHIGHTGSDDIVFESISLGQTIGFVVIFKDSNVLNIDGFPTDPTTSPLILMIDSGYGVGSGTNGSDILISIDELGIFKI
jgi:hypothetical protein